MADVAPPLPSSRKRVAAVLLASAAVVGAGAWGWTQRGGPVAATGPVLRVGAIVGQATPAERAVRDGLELALLDLNASRGDQLAVELVLRDPGGSAQTAAQQLAELHASGVRLVGDLVGDDVVDACAPLLREKEDLVAVTTNPSPRLQNAGGVRLVRVAPWPSPVAQALGSWARELQPGRPVVIHGADASGRAHRDAFVRAWGDLGESLQLEVSDPEAQRGWVVERLAELQPDLVAVLLPAAGARFVLEGLGEVAPRHLLLLERAELSPALRSVGPRLHFVVPEAPADSARRAAFVEAWGRAGKQGEPDACAMLAHDGLQALVRAAWVGGPDPSRTLMHLRATSFDGASGHVSFASDGERSPPSFRRMSYSGDGVVVPSTRGGA